MEFLKIHSIIIIFKNYFYLSNEILIFEKRSYLTQWHESIVVEEYDQTFRYSPPF